MKPSIFGKYIRNLRKERNLNISQLADISGISRPYMSQIESGTKGVPSGKVLRKLADSLDVDLMELMKVAGYFKTSDLYQHFDLHLDPPKNSNLEEVILKTDVLLFNGHPLSDQQKLKIIGMLNILFPNKTTKKEK